MSFGKFNADVAAASQKAADGDIRGIESISKGHSDGEVVIMYRHECLPEPVRIQAIAQQIDEYHDGNMFMLFSDAEEGLPTPIVESIKAVQDYLFGMTVYEMVSELSKHCEKAFGASSADQDYEEHDEDDADDDYIFGLGSRPPKEGKAMCQRRAEARCQQRAKQDFRQVKEAGFKVGILHGFDTDSLESIASVSIRVEKLSLSDEAMEAWDVNDKDYIVLLIRFKGPYIYLEEFMDLIDHRSVVSFRIGKCKKYKPSIDQARASFAEDYAPSDQETSSDSVVFERLFISNSLNQFLNESFVPMLKLRTEKRISWEEANEALLANLAVLRFSDKKVEVPLGDPMDLDATEDHKLLLRDHLRGIVEERSFPLVAMQFALEYFVKCTEFCLRCHRRLEKGFEALRPYVCSEPLCLFQYMTMGLGPNIEHEILTEPYVVDLLVSLCYSAAYTRLNASQHNVPITWKPTIPIRDLPDGLRIMVPALDDPLGFKFQGYLSIDMSRVVLDDNATAFPTSLAPYQWIALRSQGYNRHGTILSVDSSTRSLQIRFVGKAKNLNDLWTPSFGNTPAKPGPFSATTATSAKTVEVFLYDQDFDSLDATFKCNAMRYILNTLPPILDIESYLSKNPHNSLRSMDSISPAAASLLQWIVSSNRSCILQIDRNPPRRSDREGPVGKGRDRRDKRIPGMKGWLQFRFAQGAPDREVRFNKALQAEVTRKRIQDNPVIFAWHGSSMDNWHSIIRTGLDYTDEKNGRRFGDGVYFSPHHQTSLLYSNVKSVTHGSSSWPNSAFKFQSCMSLNEIINSPDEFKSRTPHYVVSQPDWHQCRYLFVLPKSRILIPPSLPKALGVENPIYHSQVKGLEICGEKNKILEIPLAAIPCRKLNSASGSGPNLGTHLRKRSIHKMEDSSDEEPDDTNFMYSDADDGQPNGPPLKKTLSCGSIVDTTAARDIFVVWNYLANPILRRNDRPPTPQMPGKVMTDFVAGALDLSKLPRLQPPSFANDIASKAIGRELRKLQAVQAKTPPHELGWYMDVEQVTNMFQWIVELHSFDADLPLAKDMKSEGITSIVMELRFAKDYPMTPPFVRVIRPRFLPFVLGGGGHVTGGGAMCMEMLTYSGWSPANSMESVLMQVRLAICNLEPRPARLLQTVAQKQTGDYGVAEAVEAYIRSANTHKWRIPEDLRTTANGV
ncbi:hypothetical protein B0T17DRAFT_569321 [Bombardia bombarda]|uniref:UBC core domain-containing protein n=1 Tax=Bombardia bombarda TaxID=252184 RepID=A0AA39XJF7_9PEZI|nr:hypothetical protein B0T17DRAFT_569321 [Bombardia bombarda]